MKRFYKTATVAPSDGGGYAIYLDDRPVRTPSRAPLALPTRALADAVAAEWMAQGEDIDPRAMMMTGLANAAIDQIAPDAASFAAGLAHYAETDLLCYRADGPSILIDRQEAAWDPILAWARHRYAIDWVLASGVLPVPQPPETLERLGQAVAELDPFRLAALSPLVTLPGSLVIGLATLERAFAADKMWDAAHVDELWQAEQWGEDADAVQRQAKRRAEFLKAADFAGLLG